MQFGTEALTPTRLEDPGGVQRLPSFQAGLTRGGADTSWSLLAIRQRLDPDELYHNN